MAKTIKKVASKNSKVNWEFPLNSTNLKYFGLGFLVILIGYGLLSTGLGGDYARVQGTWNNPLVINVAPVVLTLGYCVIIPYSIFKFFGTNKQDSAE